jgi:NTP pyrophosphatase (non-canonical NTP hydrolase)
MGYDIPLHGLDSMDDEPDRIPLPYAVLSDMADECHAVAVEHGWWGDLDMGGKPQTDGRNFGEILALIHSEVSEALEAYRSGQPINEMQYEHHDGLGCVEKGCKAPKKPSGVPSEMADILIRVFDACGAYGIDIGAAVAEKVEYNRSRPYRHGGKLA